MWNRTGTKTVSQTLLCNQDSVFLWISSRVGNKFRRPWNNVRWLAPFIIFQKKRKKGEGVHLFGGCGFNLRNMVFQYVLDIFRPLQLWMGLYFPSGPFGTGLQTLLWVICKVLRSAYHHWWQLDLEMTFRWKVSITLLSNLKGMSCWTKRW